MPSHPQNPLQKSFKVVNSWVFFGVTLWKTDNLNPKSRSWRFGCFRFILRGLKGDLVPPRIVELMHYCCCICSYNILFFIYVHIGLGLCMNSPNMDIASRCSILWQSDCGVLWDVNWSCCNFVSADRPPPRRASCLLVLCAGNWILLPLAVCQRWRIASWAFSFCD